MHWVSINNEWQLLLAKQFVVNQDIKLSFSLCVYYSILAFKSFFPLASFFCFFLCTSLPLILPQFILNRDRITITHILSSAESHRDPCIYPYSSATTFLKHMQIQMCSIGSGEGTSGCSPLLGNVPCHSLCQSSLIQLLSSLSVYRECLQSLSQCETRTRMACVGVRLFRF